MAKFLEYRKYGLGVDAPVEYIFASCKNFAVAKKYDLHCKYRAVGRSENPGEPVVIRWA